MTLNGYIAIALLLQVTVFFIRVAGAVFYRNFALLFESFHILTDLLVTVVVFAAIRLANSRYSKRYSYGLFRVEDLVSLSIAIIIAFTAVDLLLSVPSINLQSNLQSGILQLVSVVPLLFSGIVKIVGGRAVNSPSLVSDGYHNYSDVYVGLGVGAGLLVSYVTKIALFYYIAIVIAAIGILYTAFKIGRDSVTSIMDLPKDRSVVPKIEDISKENGEITSVKSVKARWAGPVIFVEVVITVNSRLTIEEAHDVSDWLEERVLREIPDVKDVVVHIEPSKDPNRVVMLPIGEPGRISTTTSKSLQYLFVTFVDGARTSSRTEKVDPQAITGEKNAQRVLAMARQNKVTDAIVLDAGEFLSSLMTVNHIDMWKADSESVEDNLELFIHNRLSRLAVR
ncbi:MAG: cation diffusion facilitator family transporter [Candidatus Thermoplasmatota archaeon]|nr:cation diffusion facilitator family transporter [Candidatus Thermoplasmatota archaeon]MCL5789788.1 cation diffusion facilitator family transporter [Candidatus Thermoplasmatota archaeon]